jgi:hypothetical protein
VAGERRVEGGSGKLTDCKLQVRLGRRKEGTGHSSLGREAEAQGTGRHGGLLAYRTSTDSKGGLQQRPGAQGVSALLVKPDHSGRDMGRGPDSCTR